jgi:HAD superfamily hydrolase (TIGR01509 family)
VTGRGALRAVLFDMDGLLVDSEPVWFEAEQAVMARLGGHWGARDQQALLGGSLDRTVSRLLAKAARPVTAERGHVARWLVDEMARRIRARSVPLQPGAGRLLAELARAGIPCALVTSSSRAVLEAVLTVTGLSFPVTVCGEDVRRAKPDPEPYLLAAARLGVPPAGCVVLEDSPAGVAAARAAGCAAVAVPSVPVQPGPGVVTLASLSELDVAMLGEMAGRNSHAPGQAVTKESGFGHNPNTTTSQV